MSQSRQYLRFQVGPQWYGIPIQYVIEVSFLMQLSELPDSPPDMLGLMTIHNEVIPVVDLRVRFGVNQPDYQLDTPIIAVRTPQGAVGLVVDNAETVEAVQDEEVIQYTGSNLIYLNGAVKFATGLLLLVDPDQFSIKL